MNLDFNQDQTLLLQTFRHFFESESSYVRVRAAEPLGFDPGLWAELVAMGAPTLRVDQALGGSGLGMMEAVLLMEEAGRHLASAPLAEAVVCARLLSHLQTPTSRQWLQAVADGTRLVTLALDPLALQAQPLLPAGAIADAALVLDGEQLLLLELEHVAAPANLGGSPLARRWLSDASLPRHVLAVGARAHALHAAALEEWKLLTAAHLAGNALRALELAAAYAGERRQFGKPIGTYQAVSHPLANLVTDAEGVRLLVWKAVCAIAEQATDAAALVSLAYVWAARTAGRSVAHALHTFGGYGLSLEYDIQLHHRRAKAAALILGDPADELLRAGQRLWGNATTPLPAAGEPGISFDLGQAARALAEETRGFFERTLTPELKAYCHHSFDGHVWSVHRALGQARLLFPDWPARWGGRDTDPYQAVASSHVWDEFDWSINAVAVANMVGRTIQWFGSAELQAETLLRIARGDAICSLGYSEPGSGSDVFAAKTRAVRDGGHWVIDGQKIFTSGANLAQYVLLLTRTDPEAAKHKGITLFLVPLDTPGIEVQPVFTYPDERTNITFYSNVRIADRYRLGEVDGGLEVMTAALKLEQGGAGFIVPHRRVLDCAVAWARGNVRADGSRAIDSPQVLLRLAQVAMHTQVSDVLFRRSLWCKVEGKPDRAYGPMSKLFSTESFLRDATDLLDLAAPDSLLKGNIGLGLIERSHRHAAATTIYGGTSEIQRSLIAEKALGMPRSR